MNKPILFVLAALTFTVFLISAPDAIAYHGLPNEIWGYTHTTSAYPNVTVYACNSSSPLPSDCSSTKWFLQAATEGTQWYLGNPQSGWYYRFWAEATDGTKSNYLNVTYSTSTYFAGDLNMPSSPTTLPAPTNLRADWNYSWSDIRDNKVGQKVVFQYPTDTSSMATKFRLYQKRPLDSSFSLVGEFSGFDSTSCTANGTLKYVGEWSMAGAPYSSTCGSWVTYRNAVSASTYSVGEYNFYVTAVNSSGSEGSPSATVKLIFFEPTTITAPTLAQSPVSLTPTFQWTVPSGWPSTLYYSIAIFDSTTAINPFWSNSVLTVSSGANSKTYDGPALDPSKQYRLSIRGWGRISTSDPDYTSLPATITDFTVAASAGDTQSPSSPTGLVATPVSPSQINLSWSASTDNVGVTGYKIYRNSVYLISITSTSYSDTGLSAGTSYNYTVAAYDAAGNISSQSGSVSATTQSASNIPNAPGLSGNLYAYGVAVNFTWSDNSTNETGFRLYTRPLGGDWRRATQSDFSANSTQMAITDYNITVGTHEYKLNACNSYGCSVDSNIVSITFTASTFAATPSNLSALVNGSSVILNWTDNANNETEYKVYQLASDGSVLAQIGFGLAANSTSYTHSAVTAGTYKYRVNACTTGCSLSSNQPTVTVSGSGGSDTSAPSTPTGLSAITTSSSQINLSWSASTDNVGVASYAIYRNGAIWYTTSNTSYSDTGLSSNTTYSYYIKAKDAAGNESGSSATVSATTPSGTATATSTTTTTTTTTTATTTTTTTTFPPPPPPSTSSIVDTYPPYVTNVSHVVESGGYIRVSVTFSEAVDQNTLTDSNIYVIKTSDGYKVPGIITKYSSSADYLTSSPAQAGVSYQLLVKKDIKDLSGNQLYADYLSATIQGPTVSATDKATVSGAVKDAAGATVAGAGVYIYSSDLTRNYGLTTDNSGLFKIVIPEGKYFAELYPPYGRNDLIKPAPVEFSVSKGESKTLNLTFGASPKIIKGKVVFADTRAVTDAEVGAYSSESGQWTSALTDLEGNYSLKVGGGTWKVGIHPKDPANAKWSYSGDYKEISFAKDATSETKIINFTVTAASAVLYVKTVDDLGQPVDSAGIIIDQVSSGQDSTLTPHSPDYKKSDAKGEASFNLPAGTYYLRGYLDPARGYINPFEQKISILSGETKSTIIIFKRKITVSVSVITGRTLTVNGEVIANSFVWAWSESGGYNETRSDANGGFVLNLAPNQKWHIGSAKEISGIPHKSSEITADTSFLSISIDLILTKFKDAPLASSVIVAQPATQQIIAQVEDGAKTTLPAGSTGSSGQVNVEIKPTIEAPSQAAAQVMSTIYDVNVKDNTGKTITVLTAEMEVAIPYDDKKLADEGASEKNIYPVYFDETTKVWVKIDNYTIDTDKNIVFARVKHLTRFAIVAAADITPPAAPATPAASALGNGQIKFTWINPIKDFDQVKIYRSETIGKLGEVIATEVKLANYTDNEVTNGKTYYYTIRSVDPAGNESTNTNQVSVIAIGSSQKTTVSPTSTLPPGQMVKAEILRNLKQGDNGEDVKTLQQLLLDEGVYPAGLITGYFGDMTRQAVIRFQEKYTSEILTPAGLISGSGFVGTGTRKKISEILSGKPAAPIKQELPPGQALSTGSGQALKAEILRNLAQGDSGEDIKALQQLLLDEGVYPEGLITGYFGTLTKQAVIRFQEKYMSEILIPAGLSSGSGFVGPATRKKIVELLK